MTTIGLGDIAAFPFVEPPDQRQVRDGVNLLQELGAFDAAGGLTAMGRKLANLPVDPRLARMVLEAEKNGCVREVMVIASALSIQDPRERPSDSSSRPTRSTAASPTRVRLPVLPQSVELPEGQAKELSPAPSGGCAASEFLNYLRVREWQDIYSQLRQALGAVPNSQAASPYQIHVSLLAGLLSHLGVKDVVDKKAVEGRRPIQEYIGARNARFAIFPGSALARKQPAWVMSARAGGDQQAVGAGQRQDRARLGGAAGPAPDQAHLLEPHWEKKQGAVVAMEKVTRVRRAARRRPQGRLRQDRPPSCRVSCSSGTPSSRATGTGHHAFLKENRSCSARSRSWRTAPAAATSWSTTRRCSTSMTARVPADVVSAAHSTPGEEAADKALLTFSPEMPVNEAPTSAPARLSRHWRQLGQRMKLTYQFEPAPRPTASPCTSAAVLNQVNADGFDWQIPACARSWSPR
ncbi:DUF3418 domain-containing protein [Nonomuraea dietziae]|uniref:DUF3418 domain-containing protein n=1 Tax=Nonomuraea dietziae TaxID=65515 RepID=UPI00338D0E27